MPSIDNRRIVSKISADARLELWIDAERVPGPEPDQVIVRVEAAPVNPADLLQLVGPADLSTLAASGTADDPRLTAMVPVAALPALAARIDVPLAVGNEGAGTVVDAGRDARHLVGRVVALRDGTYSQFRVVRAADCLVLAKGTTPAQGASASINPMTVLCMLDTMRREGHHALVHTAAASSLGQMLVRACLADGVPLVNITRSAAQVHLLKQLGAEFVLDSSSPAFLDDLVAALAATDATLAFDAIGGGPLGGEILRAMEIAQKRRAGTFSRYGSRVHKQVHVYGVLDRRPRSVPATVGTAWSMGGWLMSWALEKVDPADLRRMRERIVAELTSTFAIHYTARLSMADALSPASLVAYSRPVTGQKYLIVPSAEPVTGG